MQEPTAILLMLPAVSSISPNGQGRDLALLGLPAVGAAHEVDLCHRLLEERQAQGDVAAAI